MNDSKQLKMLNKEDLVSSLLKLKFSGAVKGGASICRGPGGDDIVCNDICSVDPCCDGNSECSLDICNGCYCV